MVDIIERYSSKTFMSIVIDKIMKQSEVSEEVANKILSEILTKIDLHGDECNNPSGYYSIRYAIMNRVLRSEY